jgi:hypothetical protein
MVYQIDSKAREKTKKLSIIKDNKKCRPRSAFLLYSNDDLFKVANVVHWLLCKNNKNLPFSTSQLWPALNSCSGAPLMLTKAVTVNYLHKLSST